MKFFIPCAEGRAEAEEIWGQLRAMLFDLGLPTTRRRIQAVTLGREGDGSLLEVGMETPDGDPVLAILEASNTDIFYACTACRTMLERRPYPLALAEGAPVVDFEEGVVGQA